MDIRVGQLEQAIKDAIVIPLSLSGNIVFRTTGLGGVFLVYCSDNRGGVASLNSKVTFTVYFDSTDGCGRYMGDDIGVEFSQARGIKPMRAIKKKRHLLDVVSKLNQWLVINEEFLYNSIQH